MNRQILKRRRKQMKLSLREAAKLCGISHGSIRNLERDPKANPSLATIRALMEGFDLTFEELSRES